MRHPLLICALLLAGCAEQTVQTPVQDMAPAPAPTPTPQPGLSTCPSTPFAVPGTYAKTPLRTLCSPVQTTVYSGKDRIPRLTVEQLTPERLRGDAQRTDDFREDERLPEAERSRLQDYRGSGYDRGHLAPAADFKFSPEAMSASFLLSNIAPQDATLNREAWAGLESATRACAKAQPGLYVLTGTLGKSGSLHGEGRVTIPASFFKLWVSGGNYRLWVMPNVAQRELSGAEYAQYEYTFEQFRSAWPEFESPVSAQTSAAYGRLCPGVIPLRRG